MTQEQKQFFSLLITSLDHSTIVFLSDIIDDMHNVGLLNKNGELFNYQINNYKNNVN